jgi:hypothetical protein
MRQRDAERAAGRFLADRYPYHHKEWNFDICPDGVNERRKAWWFCLRPDEEHADYEPHRTLTGYVHADGTVEGLY